MKRRCGSCTLCCKLLPVQELNKKANERCRHQRLTGCRIYLDRPVSCRVWSCRWLIEDVQLPRPDRTGYVIDLMVDFVIVDEGPPKGEQRIPVMQVWCDPDRPNAWRTPELRAYIEKWAEEGTATIIRFSNVEAITVFAPSLMANKQWLERSSKPNFDLKPEEAWQND
jgi:hypothetical protein